MIKKIDVLQGSELQPINTPTKQFLNSKPLLFGILIREVKKKINSEKFSILIKSKPIIKIKLLTSKGNLAQKIQKLKVFANSIKKNKLVNIPKIKTKTSKIESFLKLI